MPQWTNTPQRFGWISRLLHWTTVAMVFYLFIGVSGIDRPPKLAARELIVQMHVDVGLGLLVILIARLVTRATNPNPVHAYTISKWHKIMTISMHYALYGLLIVLSLTGVWMSPDIIDTRAGSTLASVSTLHQACATLLLLAVPLHAGNALLNIALSPSNPPPSDTTG